MILLKFCGLPGSKATPKAASFIGLETVEASAHLHVRIPLRNPCHFLPGQEALCVYNKQVGRLKESPLFILESCTVLAEAQGNYT